MQRLKTLPALLLSATVLGACGGSDGAGPPCTPEVEYRQLIRQGSLTPRPPTQTGDIWAPPVLLRQVLVATGFILVPVGIFYVEGELPRYVCSQDLERQP